MAISSAPIWGGPNWLKAMVFFVGVVGGGGGGGGVGVGVGGSREL